MPRAFCLNSGMKWILTMAIYMLTVTRANGQSYEHVSSLVTNLLDGYDSRHRPVLNQSLPVSVNVSFDILALVVSQIKT